MNLEESVITWYIKLVIKVRFSLFSIYIELLYIMLCLASTSVGGKCQHESILVHLNVSIFLNYVVHPETMHNFQIVVFDIFFFFCFEMDRREYVPFCSWQNKVGTQASFVTSSCQSILATSYLWNLLFFVCA